MTSGSSTIIFYSNKINGVDVDRCKLIRYGLTEDDRQAAVKVSAHLEKLGIGSSCQQRSQMSVLHDGGIQMLYWTQVLLDSELDSEELTYIKLAFGFELYNGLILV